MPTTTTMAAFKAELYDQLVAAEAAGTITGNVQIGYGVLVDDRRKEAIWLGNVTEGEVEETNLKAGRRTREETYEVEVGIVVSSKATPQKAEARAVELMANVEDILAADPATNTLITETGVIAAWPTEFTMQTSHEGTNPMVTITMTVTVKARLT